MGNSFPAVPASDLYFKSHMVKPLLNSALLICSLMAFANHDGHVFFFRFGKY